MKRVVLMVTLALLLLPAAAMADQINGTINFAGNVTLDTGNVSTATAWTAAVGFVLNSSLSAPNPAPFSLVTFAQNYSFNSGQAALWSVGGYTFDLTSSAITVQNGTSLVVDGIGVMSGNGYDPTPGTWHFSTQTGDVHGIFSFSASSVAQPTPEPASLGLLASGLLGLGFLRRRK